MWRGAHGARGAYRLKTRHVVCTALVAALLWVSAACTDDGSLAIPCPPGSVLCGSQCSNLQGDPANCSMCGNVCAHGMICDLGNCTGAGFDAGIAVDATTKPPGDGGSDGAGDSASASDSADSGDSATGGDSASAGDGAGDGPSDSATVEGGGPG